MSNSDLEMDLEKLENKHKFYADIRKKRVELVKKEKGNWVDVKLAMSYPTITRWVCVGKCLLCSKMFSTCEDATKHAKKEHKKELAELRKRFIV